MGLFDELDVASAADNPWAIPDNTYECVVSDLEVKQNKKGNMGMILKYKVISGEYEGSEISEYKRIPHPKDAEILEGKKKSDALSYIKMRLASLGIPESRMNDVTKDDLVGIECYVSTKDNDGFTNVRNITLQKPADAEVSGPAANPFQ
jgi:hypothetical protein